MKNLKHLTLDTLKDADPHIAKLFEKQMNAAKYDCENRPLDLEPRVVTLEFGIIPVINPDTRECETCRITMKSKVKVPVFTTPTIQVGLTRQGFTFNADDPEVLDQHHIPYERE